MSRKTSRSLTDLTDLLEAKPQCTTRLLDNFYMYAPRSRLGCFTSTSSTPPRHPK